MFLLIGSCFLVLSGCAGRLVCSYDSQEEQEQRVVDRVMDELEKSDES